MVTSKTIIIIGSSVIDFPTTQYGVFNNMIIENVQGDFSYINIELGDSITFSNGFSYVAQESTTVTFQQLIKDINTPDTILTNKNKKITSLFPVVEASPRIRYLLGLDESLNFVYRPSNKGSPFIIIDTNLSTNIYLKNQTKFAQAGSIASITSNMFYEGGPFSLDSYQLNNVPNNTLTELRFSIRGIYNEIIHFKAPIKWVINLF